MDLLEQAAGVWARKWVLLGSALLIALVVFGIRSTAEERYDATATVQVRLPDTLTSDPATTSSFYAQTAGGLVTSRDVVSQALEDVGRDGRRSEVDDAVDDITASLGVEPGAVDIEVSGASAEEAADLANALADVLVDQVATVQADDLAERRASIVDAIAELGRERQQALQAGADAFEKAALDRDREALLGSLRTATEQSPWRVVVVEPADTPDSPAAPLPLRDALLALIVALIVGAEAIVLARAIRGSLSARDPGKDAGTAAGVPGLAVRPGAAATAVTPLLACVGTARAVSVVHSGGEPSARTAGLLAELLAVRGDAVLLVDATAARPSVHTAYGLELSPGLADLRGGKLESRLARVPRVRDLAVLTAGAPGGDDGERAGGPPLRDVVTAAPQARVTVAASIAAVEELLPLVGDLEGPVVLDVPATSTRKQVRIAAETLRGLGVDLVAVTVS